MAQLLAVQRGQVLVLLTNSSSCCCCCCFGQKDRIHADFAVHVPLVQRVRDGLLKLAEAVNGPEVATRPVKGRVVKKEAVVFARVEQRPAVVEDVVEEGLELGPPLADPSETLADEVDFGAQGVESTEGLAGRVDFRRRLVLEREREVVFVEEGVGAEEKKGPMPAEA